MCIIFLNMLMFFQWPLMQVMHTDPIWRNDWDYFWLFVSVYPNCSLFNSLCRIDVVCTFYGPAVLEFLNGINLGASIFDMWHMWIFLKCIPNVDWLGAVNCDMHDQWCSTSNFWCISSRKHPKYHTLHMFSFQWTDS